MVCVSVPYSTFPPPLTLNSKAKAKRRIAECRNLVPWGLELRGGPSAHVNMNHFAFLSAQIVNLTEIHYCSQRSSIPSRRCGAVLVVDPGSTGAYQCHLPGFHPEIDLGRDGWLKTMFVLRLTCPSHVQTMGVEATPYRIYSSTFGGVR